VGGKRRLLTLDACYGDCEPRLRRPMRHRTRQHRAGGFYLAYADWLAAHIEEWTVTTQGELAAVPRHYIRINPTHPDAPDPHADPNATMIQVANGGGLRPRGTWSAAIFFISCGSAFALRTIQSCVIQSK